MENVTENTAIIAEDKKQFLEEQNTILKTLLEYRFFNPWREIVTNAPQYTLIPDSALELFITTECNQKCEYCYLHNNHNLYPDKVNNRETIIKNLKILYDYILLNDFKIPALDMFSGEIWHTDFGFEILNITLDYIRRGMKIRTILLPTNGYFLNSNETLHKMQNIINQYNNVGTQLQISFSIDGKIIDDNIRPRNNQEPYTTDFYEKMFVFAKMNGYKFHPMVSSSNVKYWKENYQWWKEQLEYYDFSTKDLMMLEVRNPDWTDESIKDFCDFLISLADECLYEQCGGNIELFANSIAGIRENDGEDMFEGYVPWFINRATSFLGCTVSNALTVRLGDLAICPCHRQAYDKYLYGYFIVEDDMITDIKAVNPQMAIHILLGNIHTVSPVCSTCIYNQCCHHGCYGAQIEANADPFLPDENVCKMFKTKYSTLFQYYRDKGIVDYYKSVSPKEFNTSYVQHFLELEQLDREAK